jgi:hypothetical protein
LAKAGSPGFGFHSRIVQRARDRAGQIELEARTIARASASVDGSGTVGPEPITAGSSPGTSEIASVTTRAGWAARAAGRP